MVFSMASHTSKVNNMITIQCAVTNNFYICGLSVAQFTKFCDENSIEFGRCFIDSDECERHTWDNTVKPTGKFKSYGIAKIAKHSKKYCYWGEVK